MRKRARREEDKQLRRRAILEAALRIWTQSTFDEFTMAEVARRARLAKGTLYLYFPTKEALLLELLQVRLDPWLADIEVRLEAAGSLRDPDGTARLIVSTLVADEALLRLLMILGTILEHNVPEQRIHEFKSWLVERLARTGAALERLPFVPPGSGMKLLLHLQALVAGVGQLARPAPVVARVLASPGFEPLRLDFEAELSVTLAALMRGHAAETAGARVRSTRREGSSGGKS